MISYPLHIISPNGKIFEGEAASIIGTGETGSFGIMAHHAPLIISLTYGPLTVKQESDILFFAMSSGVLEVNEQGHVLILVDSAVRTESLDSACALAASHKTRGPDAYSNSA